MPNSIKVEYPYLQSQPGPTALDSPLDRYSVLPETSVPKPSEEQVLTILVQVLSPLEQAQLSSVVSVPRSEQGPWETADSTSRRVETRRMRRDLSILVVAVNSWWWQSTLVGGSQPVFVTLAPRVNFLYLLELKQDFPDPTLRALWCQWYGNPDIYQNRKKELMTIEYEKQVKPV